MQIKDVRCAAILAIGELKDPIAAPALIDAIRDEDKTVRRAAAKVLTKIDDPKCYPCF